MVLNWGWLLNGIGLLVVAIISFYIFFYCKKNNHALTTGRLIGVNGVAYLVNSVLFFLWAFGFLKPLGSDITVITELFNIVKAALFLGIVYTIVRDRNLLYILFLFLLTAIAIPYNISLFFVAISVTSFVVVAISSFDTLLLENRHIRKVGILSIIYSIVSIMIIFSSIIFKKEFITLWILPITIMSLIFLLIFEYMKRFELEREEEKPKVKKIHWPILFSKFIVFIISVTVFMLLSTIVVHEMGHSFAAQFYGCEKSKAVIYDIADYPHTEIVCEGEHNDTVITLAGVFLPIIMGVVFFIMGGSFATNLSYLIFGFSLMIPSRDLEGLGVSKSISFLVVLCGVAILLYGIVRLSIEYVKQKGTFTENKKFIDALNEPDKYFWIDEKTPVRDLYGLLDRIDEMNNLEFEEFMKRKGEIIGWIDYPLCEKNLCRELKEINEKREVKIAIMKHLLEKETKSDECGGINEKKKKRE